MENKLFFSDSATSLVLEALGRSVREDGVIIVDRTGKPSLTVDGREVNVKDFVGIKNGYLITSAI